MCYDKGSIIGTLVIEKPLYKGEIVMRVKWRALASMLFLMAGTLGWLYIGAFLILTRPVKGLVMAYFLGDLSVWKLVFAIVQGFLYLSLAGAVWCVGYMLSGHFKKDET